MTILFTTIKILKMDLFLDVTLEEKWMELISEIVGMSLLIFLCLNLKDISNKIKTKTGVL